jgi:hypothetical protein
VVIDAVDDISVKLELGNDGGRERDPAGVQFGKRDRLIPGLAQSFEQALLLNVSGRHRPDCRPFQRDWTTAMALRSALLVLDVGDWDLLGAAALRTTASGRSRPTALCDHATAL